MCECTEMCWVVPKLVAYGRVTESLGGVMLSVGCPDAMTLVKRQVMNRCVEGNE